jgi:hypothetical protein
MESLHTLFIRGIVTFALAAWITGCSTTHTVSAKSLDQSLPQLRPGQVITLTLRDGRRFSAIFVGRTGSELITKKGRYQLRDIRVLEYETFSPLRTVGVIVVTGAAIYAIWIGVWLWFFS